MPHSLQHWGLKRGITVCGAWGLSSCTMVCLACAVSEFFDPNRPLCGVCGVTKHRLSVGSFGVTVIMMFVVCTSMLACENVLEEIAGLYAWGDRRIRYMVYINVAIFFLTLVLMTYRKRSG